MFALPLLIGLLTVQMPDGATVKNIFKGGQLSARSVEVRRTVDVAGVPTRYFASRSRTLGEHGCLATIDSWSTMDGTPIRAVYQAPKLTVVVSLKDGVVEFVKNRVRQTVDLPEGIPVLLSQLDPLLLSENLAKRSLQCAVIVPEACQVVPCVVRYSSKANIQSGAETREGVRFAVESVDGKSWVTLDADGGFIRFLGENGLEARLDHWRNGDEALFEMARPAGLG